MRIVLDTNVISNLTVPEPHPAVLGWVAAEPRDAFRMLDVFGPVKKADLPRARKARSRQAQRRGSARERMPSRSGVNTFSPSGAGSLDMSNSDFLSPRDGHDAEEQAKGACIRGKDDVASCCGKISYRR